MSPSPQSLSVEPHEAGLRLDRFLAERLSLSRSQVRRLLERGAVRVGGRTLAASAKGRGLEPGSVVEVAAFSRSEDERARETPDADVVLVAHGDGWLAVDKPAGVPVHPLRPDETGTLLNALLPRFPQIHGVGEGGLRSGVVHRLDVDTSGVLLFATREDVWQRLRSAFSAHRVDKLYRAIVLGTLEGEGDLELGLLTARHRPARVRVVGPDEAGRARGVRASRLHFRSLRRLEGATLVEVRPQTGFLHQIRVSLAHLGHPVAGDRTYGPASDPTGAARQMLHASAVRWEHICGASPDAADFAELLSKLAS